MPSKTEEYLALAQRTANGLTRYWESWTDYLTTASRLYKYPFADQLMIYAQRPDATACADFDIWNSRMNRTDWLKMMKSRVEITTYTSYERAIVHKIVPYFEPLHYTLQDMEQHPKYIQDFYQHELDRGLTANTVIHYHANIRKCLQYAFQIGMIRSNPADRVERPRKEKFKSEIYSGEELEQLFTAIQGDPSEFGVIMAAFYLS